MPLFVSAVILTLSLSKGKDPEGLDSPQLFGPFQQPIPRSLPLRVFRNFNNLSAVGNPEGDQL